MRPRVVIVQRIIPEYRVPFFLQLEKLAADSGIDLIVLHGLERKGQSPRSVGKVVPINSEFIINHYLFNGRFVWQHIPKEFYSCDLLVVEQANRILNNYIFMLRKIVGIARYRLAFWGHGINWQSKEIGLSERIKVRTRKYVDYWFCYTRKVMDVLCDVPYSKKCNVNNAIDTSALSRLVEDAAKNNEKEKHTLLFIGSMREDKRLDWIFKSLEIAKEKVPGLSALFVGDGPLSQSVESFCATCEWAEYRGAVFGPEKAECLWRAAAILMPGLVGLVALDSFVGRAPILTTPNCGAHSPEFAYLDPGENCLVSQDNIDSYADMIVDYLQSDDLQSELQRGCEESMQKYTIENMATNFFEGIKLALKR